MSQFNKVYPSALAAMLRGELDIESVDLRIELVSGYGYQASHDNISDLTGQLATSPVLTGVTVSGGTVNADPVTVSGVGPGDDVEGLVLFVDGSGLLVSFMARRADTVPLAIPTDGGSITFSWPTHLLKI